MSTPTNFPESFPKERGQIKHPGTEAEMEHRPIYEDESYVASRKLFDCVAIITGGDSGIGRAVALLYAKEGADVCIPYLKNTKDAEETKKLVENQGRRCLVLQGDLCDRKFCTLVIEKTVETFKKLDILVCHHGVQYWEENFENLDEDLLLKTFQTNFFSFVYLIKDSLKHLKSGGTIITTSSVTAFRGHVNMVDYASSNGAITTLTRSLAKQLADKGIRINSVAPGPIWTPFIPSSFPEERLKEFGHDTLMKRAGQPSEVAPSYVFLASKDSSYMTGQTMHPNGGIILNV
jgi:NAD(P)-dependent dehydrogenase (short-subunit alcohol dehydrogenase family)